MSRKDPGIPDWLKVIIILMITTGAAAGTGHVIDGPALRPATVCAELRA